MATSSSSSSSSKHDPLWNMHSMPWIGRNAAPPQQRQDDATRTSPPPPLQQSPSIATTTLRPPVAVSFPMNPPISGSFGLAAHPSVKGQSQFLTVVLSRTSTSVPWGITLSLAANDARTTARVLVVGYVMSGERPEVRQHSSSYLLRGDCVVAVNGYPVSTLGSLGDVTAYFRQCMALHLSVWRPATVPPKMTAEVANALKRPYVHPQPFVSVQGNHVSPFRAASLQSIVPAIATPSFQYCGTPILPYFRSPTMTTAGTPWTRIPVVTPPSAPRKVAQCVSVTGGLSVTTPPTRKPSQPPAKRALSWSDPYTNPLFRDEAGRPIPYEDSWEPDDADEGQRYKLFLAPIGNFHDWLSRRKSAWRSNWDATRPVANLVTENSGENDDDRVAKGHRDNADRHDCAVAIDFWSQQGYASWDEWLRAAKHKWSKQYSWNRRKRKHFEVETKVYIEEDFGAWLQVRKRQWLVSRRKRLRQRRCSKDDAVASSNDAVTAVKCDSDVGEPPASASTYNPDIFLIDELLEEEEQRRKERESRPPVDLSFLFEDGACPDDTVVHILGYLEPMEYGKLLCIRRKWRQALIQREAVWRDLCPKRWTLPRRPRKPWHEMFFMNLRREKDSSQKRWDDLLAKLSRILEKGDFVQQVEKLVAEAERSFGFHVNYSSGVVCERNAILNLAVIQKRHKIVRWLVEVKGADIETFDRGHFTPLLNAAWGGDKYLVRLLLQHGADRTKVGLYHYTKPLASPDFQGRTAADWADEKGFKDIATLIRMGL